MKIKFTQTTEKEIEAQFPIYLTDGTTMCAIYSEDCIYDATSTKVEKSGLKPTFWLGLLPTIATQSEWMDMVAKAKEYQRQTFVDIVWHESMEQNPAMADMTVKDYSRERLEEMNMGVRESDQAEQMERNEENQD